MSDYIFHGFDRWGGATFEHSCGWTVRVGPEAYVSEVGTTLKGHDCHAYQPATVAAHLREWPAVTLTYGGPVQQPPIDD